MALWDFLGGAADTLLDKRKRDMAAQLQKDLEEQRRNFQLTLDQKQAERQASRDERQAETDMLNRKREEERYTTERADRQAREAAQDARANEQLAITRENAAGAREDRRIAREEQSLYRESLASKAQQEAADKAAAAFRQASANAFDEYGALKDARFGTVIEDFEMDYAEAINAGDYRAAQEAARRALAALNLSRLPGKTNVAVAPR